MWTYSCPVTKKSTILLLALLATLYYPISLVSLRDLDKLQTTATEGEAGDGYYETMRHIPLSSSPSQPTTTAAEDCHYDNV